LRLRLLVRAFRRPPVETAEIALKESTAVFSGEVIDLEEHDTGSVVTLQASEVWKGPQRDTFEVTTSIMCDYPFKEGKEYLVYAGQGYGKPSMSVSLCGDTQPISEPEDLEAIRLADTSGILPGSGVPGLAGLTATDALLLMRRLLQIR
jgi:hypothetical protein